MGPKGIVTTVVAASVAALGLAAPAFATDGITQNAVGTYEFKGKSVGKRTWTATPCADDAPQCIQITEFDTDDVGRGNPLWSGNAHWQVGSWIMFVVVPNAVECEDGTEHGARMNYSWDAVENTGWRSFNAFNDPGICGGEAESVATPFELTKLGPPPPSMPVDVAPPPPAAEIPPPPPPAAEIPPPPPAAAEAPPLPPGTPLPPPAAAEAPQPPAPAE